MLRMYVFIYLLHIVNLKYLKNDRISQLVTGITTMKCVIHVRCVEKWSAE